MIDALNEDPATVLESVASSVEEKVQKDFEEKIYQGKVEKTFTDYEKANPDFKPMWDSGEISEHMQANPGYNAIASHIALKKEAGLKEATEKAEKDVETPSPKTDARLLNSAEHGGQNAVITERFRERTGADSHRMNLDTCRPTIRD